MIKVTQEEVDEVIRLHWLYLSNSKTGQRADFADKDLSGFDFKDVDLRFADLKGANLRFADLRGANFTGANWGGSVWSNAVYNSNTTFPDFRTNMIYKV